MQASNDSPLLAAVRATSFRTLLDDQLLPVWNQPDEPVPILAVSGGRDSMFLLYLFRELRQSGQLRRAPVVFHLHHGLRDSADGDLDFVESQARRADFPFYFERRDVAAFARRTRGGLEAAGRHLRYRALARLRRVLGGGLVLTAHHATDYLESVLIHLVRGGGPRAMRTLEFFTQLEGLPVLRPLLGFAGENIAKLVKLHAVPYVEDASNASSDFLRNRLRHSVVNTLRAEGLDPVRMWQNFHPEPAAAGLQLKGVARAQIDSGERAPVSMLCLDRRLLPAVPDGPAALKALLDLALPRLALQPIARTCLDELYTQWTRSSEFSFSLVTKNWRIWSDRRGPLWLFRNDAPALRAARIESLAGPGWSAVHWNGRRREYQLAPGQRLASFAPGQRVRLADGSSVALRKILREAGVPAPVRAYLPLVVGEQSAQVHMVCLGFWESLRDRRFDFPESKT